MNIHSNSIRIESTGGRIILKTTKEVIVANGIKFSIALEAVDRTLALDGISTLDIVMIGQEHLFGAMELSATSDRLLRPVIPPDVDLNVGASTIGLDLLHSRHIGRLRGVGRPHQHAIAGCSARGTTQRKFHISGKKNLAMNSFSAANFGSA